MITREQELARNQAAIKKYARLYDNGAFKTVRDAIYASFGYGARGNWIVDAMLDSAEALCDIAGRTDALYQMVRLLSTNPGCKTAVVAFLHPYYHVRAQCKAQYASDCRNASKTVLRLFNTHLMVNERGSLIQWEHIGDLTLRLFFASITDDQPIYTALFI